MKKLINVIGYIIFVAITTWLLWLVVKGFDNTPIGRYHNAIDEGMSWTEYVEKN